MHTDQRITRLENQVRHMEVVLERKLDTVVADYQHISLVIDKLVTRKEFTPVQIMVYGAGCAIFGGLILFFLFNVLPK